MKKIMYVAMIVLGTISFSACENKSTTDSETDETVMESDTSSMGTGTEMEVDTTTSTDTTSN